MRIIMKSNRGSGYEAFGEYNDGTVIVKKGSRIRLEYAENIHRSRQVVEYRNDPSCVDYNGNVLKDCCFSSPSAAAQFVNGCSTDGKIAWRVAEKLRLKDWLEQDYKENN